MRVGSIIPAVLLSVAIFAAGCNVYEGLYEEGASEDPEVLLEDARIAMQQDRPADAVDHLRKALSNAQPGSVLHQRVQIKLASATLQVHDVNALSFSRMARNLIGDEESPAAAKTHSLTCNFPAAHGREAFDPRDGIDFERLGSDASREALDESRTLIARVFNGGDGEQATSFPCEAEALDEAVAALLDQGLSTEEIAEALVDYAVALATTAYLDVVESGGDQAQFFYATPPSGPDYVGTCFPDAATCEGAIGQVRVNLGSFDCATRILQKRADLLGSTSAGELADLGRDGYLTLQASLDNAACIVY